MQKKRISEKAYKFIIIIISSSSSSSSITTTTTTTIIIPLTGLVVGVKRSVVGC
ncbi:hypothetical protein DPMN_149764 [Dreissena polymorpha]|uniref:Uncharacterized protein n=1 Tax=Dreissena polymorpha TaxID=45954 RepID=A0A9D4FGF5_DREPO|nr:hypothetical protein DPMN_149764 [Dreissena polymorpha]